MANDIPSTILFILFIAGLGAMVLVWVAMRPRKDQSTPEEQPPVQEAAVPYKLEAPVFGEAPLKVEGGSYEPFAGCNTQPSKRKYTKRSKYWGSNRMRAKLKRARAIRSRKAKTKARSKS